ncbi:MAG: RICIN domain-containing protein [Acidimicrobiales bacterium]
MRARIALALMCASGLLAAAAIPAAGLPSVSSPNGPIFHADARTGAAQVASPTADRSGGDKPDGEKGSTDRGDGEAKGDGGENGGAPPNADKPGDSPGDEPDQPKVVLEKPNPGVQWAFATYRVYATQFEPTVPGSVEVAVPDKCVKFAALRDRATLALLKCGASYSTSRDYRLVVRRDDGKSGIVPVKEVGPWNIDDNWWSARRGDEPRRLFADLPAGRPAAQVASSAGYNRVPDCKDLEGKPTGQAGGADQFGRCVRNPAGIDLSVAAARALGFGPLENAWVDVTLLWEPVEVTAVNVRTGLALTATGGSRVTAGPVTMAPYGGAPSQHWRLHPVNADEYALSAGNSGQVLVTDGGSLTPGAPLAQRPPGVSAFVHWRMVPHTNLSPGAAKAAAGVVSLISMGSLQMADAGSGGPPPAVQVPPSAAAGATWRLTIVEPPPPAAKPDAEPTKGQAATPPAAGL